MEEKAEAEGASTEARSLVRDATWALGQLRHLYSQMVGGYVSYPAEAARGLLSPAIAMLEPLIDQGNAAQPPPEALSDSSADSRALLEARKLLEEALEWIEAAEGAYGSPSLSVAARPRVERIRAFLGGSNVVDAPPKEG